MKFKVNCSFLDLIRGKLSLVSQVPLHLRTGANPAIVSYNTRDGKIMYNAAGSQVRYENKNISSTSKKRSSLHYVSVVNSEIV
jgi:hypothetical protein